ncbi:MAG: hypothetical protein L0Z62_08005 [Gemmataceae bacterium]|nr:hypothetical protein [Gemmataceae bacterium]
MEMHHLIYRQLLAGLAVCALCFPGRAAGADTGATPAPGTAEYVRSVGPRLLAEQRWPEAAEVYGGWYGELEEAVLRAVQSPPGATPRERDRSALGLYNFLFRHLDFPRSRWRHGLSDLAPHAERYAALLRKLPDAERRDALDFDRVELLLRVGKTDEVSEADRATLTRGLRDKPDSWPLMVVYLFWLEHRGRPRSPTGWEEARKLLSGNLGKLLLARHVRGPQWRAPDRVAQAILREGWALAPSREEKARLLHALATNLDGEARIHGGSAGRQKALEVAVRVYEEFPRTRAAAESRALAVALTLRLEGPGPAMVLLRQLQHRGPEHRPGLEWGLCDLAAAFARQGHDDRRAALLREVTDAYSGSAASVEAMSALAESCFLLGEPKQGLDWLQRCSTAKAAGPEHPDRLPPEHFRSEAGQRLALWYEEQGQWDQARRAWRAWEPEGATCGTCAASMRTHREERATVCQVRADLQRGRYAGAVQTCLESMRGGHFASWELMPLLVRLYREAGQEADLLRLVDGLERAASRDRQRLALKSDRRVEAALSSVRTVRDLVEIARLGDRKEVEPLMSMLQRVRGESPQEQDERARRRAGIVEALGRCGGSEVRPLRDALWGNEHDLRWVVTALGESRSSAALDVLESAARRYDGAALQDLGPVLGRAIARHGEAGKRVLRQFAAQGRGPMREVARNWLALRSGGGPPAEPWPRPRPGSLPQA